MATLNVTDDLMRRIFESILSFPSGESHSDRKDSSKGNFDLQTSTMYRMYKDLWRIKKLKVALEKYRKIFSEHTSNTKQINAKNAWHKKNYLKKRKNT